MALIDTLQGLGRAIAYHPGLAQMVGSVKAGLMLDQLIYWWPKRNDDRGVYKTQKSWTEETGLSRREQETARKQLSELGIVETEYDRLNHRLYFIVNEERLEELWQEHVHSRMSESDSRESTKRTVGNVQNVQSSIVHKTTTEITTPDTSRAPARGPKPPPPMKDELARYIDESMRAVQPYENFGRERKQITTIAATCRRRDPERPQDVADAMMGMLQALRQNGSEFWQRQPFTPSFLMSQWERIEREGQRLTEVPDWAWDPREAREADAR
jgi:hypothetical protein